MPREPYSQQDLHILNLVLQHYPEINEVIRVVQQISQKCAYPILSFYELAEGLGGMQAQITFQKQNFRLADVQRLIPAYYFPITNENDLIAKVADPRTFRPRSSIFSSAASVRQPLLPKSPSVSTPPCPPPEDIAGFTAVGPIGEEQSSNI